MRVLLLNDSLRSGGAGIAMRNLEEGLSRAGADVHIAALDVAPDKLREHLLRQGAGWIERVTRSASFRFGLVNNGVLSTFRLGSEPWFRDADVVNFHNLHGGYFNFLALPKLTRVKPAVLTLHDMWSFTGHCAYSFGCERWQSGCGQCPDLETYPGVPRDATHLEHRLKRWAFRNANLHIVAISRWIEAQARASPLNARAIHHIPNGIDLVAWHPVQMAECREKLGLPADRKIILYCAAQLADRRKGFDLLTSAVQRLPEKVRKESLLLVLGHAEPGQLRQVSMETVPLGFVVETEKKVLAYGAADVFAFPTRADNLPLVLQESMACGTPMVSFAVGGVPDLVRNGETGFTAMPENVEDFVRLLAQLLGDDALRFRMGVRCREIAEAEYSVDLQAKRYLELFRGISTMARS